MHNSKASHAGTSPAGLAPKKNVYASLVDLFQSKVHAAMHMLSTECKGTSLPLDKVSDDQSTTVRDELARRHPPGQPTSRGILLQPDIHVIHPVLFDCIDGATMHNAAICTNGSAAWPIWPRCNRVEVSLHVLLFRTNPPIYATVSHLLHEGCALHVDPSGLEILTVCRLIVLENCPGVRPIAW